MPAMNAINFSVVGLGKIGGTLARQALEKGFHVVGLSKSGIPEDLTGAGLTAATSLADLADKLAPPRIVLLYVPAGKVVDTLLDELAQCLSPGDVVVDGGNSYWGDSIRRHRRLLLQVPAGLRFASHTPSATMRCSDHHRLAISNRALTGTSQDQTVASVAVNCSPITRMSVGTQQAAPLIKAGIVPIRA